MTGATYDDAGGRSDAPVPAIAAERIASLDFIRGLAVMGILFANIVAFGQPFSAYFWPGGFIVPPGDRGGALWIAQFVLVDGKMRGLFTLLFGAGMALFVERARAHGGGRWLQARRLGWLLLFGLAHYFLLWTGDILTLYAVSGLFVLATIDWKPQDHLLAGAMAYVAGGVFLTVSYLQFDLGAATQPGVLDMKSGAIADDAVESALMQGGSWIEVVRHRVTEHGFEWLAGVWQTGWETIPLMWAGIALYRLGLFDGRLDPRSQARWGWIGLAVGTLATLALALWVRGEQFTYFATLLAFVGASMLTRLPAVLGLAALLALWGSRADGRFARRVAATGRMAFSNYLGTSFVMLFVFSGWAFDLFGRLDRPRLYVVALATCLLMLAWSQPWLARFRYGPLEWLWRCLTYARRFPLRR